MRLAWAQGVGRRLELAGIFSPCETLCEASGLASGVLRTFRSCPQCGPRAWKTSSVLRPSCVATVSRRARQGDVWRNGRGSPISIANVRRSARNPVLAPDVPQTFRFCTQRAPHSGWTSVSRTHRAYQRFRCALAAGCFVYLVILNHFISGVDMPHTCGTHPGFCTRCAYQQFRCALVTCAWRNRNGSRISLARPHSLTKVS